MINEEINEKLKDYENAFTGIIGQSMAKKQIASTLMSGRSLIISGPPGIGKTSTAKTVAGMLGETTVNDCGYNCSPNNPLCPICLKAKKEGREMPTKTLKGEDRFIRVQGSPDLTAEDLIGDIDPVIALQKGPLSIEAFTPGKIFKANRGILFFDEINRAPQRLQNALLQVLEEKKATIGSYEIDFPAEFILIGTMNPKDTSTEKLSEVFLDRFDVVGMVYPSGMEEEVTILNTKEHLSHITVTDSMKNIIVGFVQSIRHNPDVLFGPSVRGTIGLMDRSQAFAALGGKDEVDIEDMRAVAASVLSHRVVLKPSAGFEKSKFDFINEQMDAYIRSDATRSDELR